jgi:NTP pyrophosphatase (non-canonical NTP hydrolase)
MLDEIVVTPENYREIARKLNENVSFNMGMTPFERKVFLSLAIAGEVGELANLVKKQWRDGVNNQEEQIKELADIQIYVNHLWTLLGVDQDQVCADKLREVLKRPFAIKAAQANARG